MIGEDEARRRGLAGACGCLLALAVAVPFWVIVTGISVGVIWRSFRH
jgi:hypothetical protein